MILFFYTPDDLFEVDTYQNSPGTTDIINMDFFDNQDTIKDFISVLVIESYFELAVLFITYPKIKE